MMVLLAERQDRRTTALLAEIGDRPLVLHCCWHWGWVLQCYRSTPRAAGVGAAMLGASWWLVPSGVVVIVLWRWSGGWGLVEWLAAVACGYAWWIDLYI
jgi:hypothetical protein